MKSGRVIKWIIISLVIFFGVDFIIDKVMMHGVNKYYGLNEDSNVLLIGHSHLMLATDKERIERETGLKVSKYCREGVNVYDRRVMVDHFLSHTNIDSLKYVLYGVDLATFTGSGLSENSYKLMYPFMDDENVGGYVKSQSEPLDYWLHKIVRTTRYNDDGLKNSAFRGWLNNWDNMKFNTIDIEPIKSNWQPAMSGIWKWMRIL